MTRADDVGALRTRVAELVRRLPEAQATGEQHVAFSVRGRNFAYFLTDHHGDGRVGIACKAAAGVQADLVDAEPGRFYVPAYLGPKGWVGLDLGAGEVDWDEVTGMLTDAYRLVAPKRLAAQLG